MFADDVGRHSTRSLPLVGGRTMTGQMRESGLKFRTARCWLNLKAAAKISTASCAPVGLR
jgi:hypothetical protein